MPQLFMIGGPNGAGKTTTASYLLPEILRGYNITLLFLWVESPALATARIASRVAAGGHNIPTKDIERRCYRG